MAIPKYQQIKDELKQQIISGKFENGDKFYTEAELIQMFNVSSITVVRVCKFRCTLRSVQCFPAG